MDDKKERIESFKNISWLFFLFLILLLFFLVVINFLFGIYSWDKLYVDIINSLIGIMIPLVLFNIFYEKITKSYYSREISERITETLMFNGQVLDSFSKESKLNFIRQSMVSILNETVGEMLYHSLLKKYLKQEFGYRHNFKYYISYADKSEQDSLHFKDALTFITKDYYIVKQEISFNRNLSDYSKNKSIRIGFSYKESTLDGLYRRAEFLFRENLWLKTEHIDYLQGLDDDEMLTFAKEVLKFSIIINGHEVNYHATNEKEIEGFHLILEIPSKLNLNEECSIKFTFQMPQEKNQKKFIVIISEPTENVEVLFMHLEDKVKVEAIPFFDESESITRLPNDTIKIDIEDWVLPRAGAVFVWDDIEKVNHTCTDQSNK